MAHFYQTLSASMARHMAQRDNNLGVHQMAMCVVALDMLDDMDTLRADNETHCAECGSVFTRPLHDVGTGYGMDSAWKRYCYDCCGVREQHDMRQTGKATLYVVNARKDGTAEISDWPGSFKIRASHERMRHAFSRQAWQGYFMFSGKWWRYVNIGDNDVAHCTRLKCLPR